MAKILVELIRGDIRLSVPPGDDDESSKDRDRILTVGDTFEVTESGYQAIKDRVRKVKTRKVTKSEEESIDSSSPIPEDLIIDPSKEDEVTGIPIERLNITLPTIRVLKMAGYEYVEQLKGVTKEEFLNIKGLGEKRVAVILEDVKAALKSSFYVAD